MRLTKDELMKRYNWNDKNPMNGDIVSVMYGDIPLIHYTYDRVRYDNSDRLGYFDNDMDRHISAIQSADHYMYACEGEFSKYVTLIGGVRVFKNWHIGTCDLNIKYNGKIYNLTLCDLYGKIIMTLTLNTSTIYRTYDIGTDSSWISTRWQPMSREEAIKVLDVKRVEDYGDVVKQAVNKCRKMIEVNE